MKSSLTLTIVSIASLGVVEMYVGSDYALKEFNLVAFSRGSLIESVCYCVVRAGEAKLKDQFASELILQLCLDSDDSRCESFGVVLGNAAYFRDGDDSMCE